MIIEHNSAEPKVYPFEEFEVGDLFAPVYSPDTLCLRVPLAEEDETSDLVRAVELKTGKFIKFDDEEMMYYYPDAKVIY